MACPWGSGKTWIMEAKVKGLVQEIIEEKRKEKVLVLVFARGVSLLSLQIKDRFKDLQVVEVKTIEMKSGEKCGLEEIGKGFDHVMVDEFYWDFMSLPEENKEEFFEFAKTKKTVWIALSNVLTDDDLKFKLSSEHNDIIKATYEECFPKYIVSTDLTMALRSSIQQTNDLKSVEDVEGFYNSTDNPFTSRLESGSNQAQGKGMKDIFCASDPANHQGLMDIPSLSETSSVCDMLQQVKKLVMGQDSCSGKLPKIIFVIEESIWYVF